MLKSQVMTRRDDGVPLVMGCAVFILLRALGRKILSVSYIVRLRQGEARRGKNKETNRGRGRYGSRGRGGRRKKASRNCH